VFQDWELAHTCIVVDDLDRAREMYGAFLGTSFTDVANIDLKWISPMRGGVLERCVGQTIWSLDSTPPVELFAGEEGSPWYTPPGTQYLHHLGYWGKDMDAQSQQLQAAGFEIEFTMPPREDGELRGFAYFLHPTGMRIEVQTAADKEGMARWYAGEKLQLDWQD
jgi:catechol 2,3-dioxygenase-like lactoylglutathione lyase family enzyme